MGSRLQRVTSFLIAVVLLVFPFALSADDRNRERMDLHQLADELTRVLGSDHVDVVGEPAPATSSAGSAEEEAIVDAMNRERAADGLTPLHLNQQLSAAANDRVRDMFAQHYFDHVAPDGTSPFIWIDRHGYSYHEAGENLAVGYRGAEAVVSGWMHSPGHRANVMGRNYEDVGIAIAEESPARKYRGPLIVAIYGGR